MTIESKAAPAVYRFGELVLDVPVGLYPQGKAGRLFFVVLARRCRSRGTTMTHRLACQIQKITRRRLSGLVS